MPKPLSVDLRERVVADYDQGVRPVELAPKYRVSERWVFSLLKRRRELGTIEPLKGKTGPKPKLDPHLEHLSQLVQHRPDATLEELRQQLPVEVCVVTVWNALQKLGITLKKSPEGGRARTA